MTEELREKFKKPPLHIDVDRLLQNKVYRLTAPTADKKSTDKAIRYLQNFGINLLQARRLLRNYGRGTTTTKDKFGRKRRRRQLQDQTIAIRERALINRWNKFQPGRTLREL